MCLLTHMHSDMIYSICKEIQDQVRVPTLVQGILASHYCACLRSVCCAVRLYFYIKECMCVNLQTYTCMSVIYRICEEIEHQVRVYEERPDERMLASYYRSSKVMGFPFQVHAIMYKICVHDIIGECSYYYGRPLISIRVYCMCEFVEGIWWGLCTYM
jgi:hypothetical protein